MTGDDYNLYDKFGDSILFSSFNFIVKIHKDNNS